ncbi:MAG: trypsin-like peptidase domain-containing protein [Planctomycetota bacterium]
MRRTLALLLPILLTVVLALTAGEGEPSSLDDEQALIRAVLERSSRTFREVAAKAKTTVVHIRCRMPRGPQELLAPSEDPSHKRPVYNMGSGVIVDPKGFILTSYHVVRNAISMRVFLNDRREFDADLISFDPRSDLAMLKIEAGELSCGSLGNSDAVEVGDWVIAIGSPLGLEQTVTAGIISATGRDFIGHDDEAYAYQDFIQTDAAINVGSSGGPLLNLKGEVIGITHKRAIGSGATGLAFATPVNLVKNVLESMKRGSGAPRGQLGVGLKDVNQEIAAASGLNRIYGAQVQFVHRDSPAAKAGLRTGDIILQINGLDVRNRSHLRTLIACSPLRQKGRLTIFRRGQQRALPFTLVPSRAIAHDPFLGMAVTNLTKKIADRIGLERPQGALVISVTPKGVAMKAGMRIGMVVAAVNNEPTPDITAYNAAIKRNLKSKELTLFIPLRGKLHLLRFTRDDNGQLQVGK